MEERSVSDRLDTIEMLVRKLVRVKRVRAGYRRTAVKSENIVEYLGYLMETEPGIEVSEGLEKCMTFHNASASTVNKAKRRVGIVTCYYEGKNRWYPSMEYFTNLE